MQLLDLVRGGGRCSTGGLARVPAYPRRIVNDMALPTLRLDMAANRTAAFNIWHSGPKLWVPPASEREVTRSRFDHPTTRSAKWRELARRRAPRTARSRSQSSSSSVTLDRPDPKRNHDAILPPLTNTFSAKRSWTRSIRSSTTCHGSGSWKVVSSIKTSSEVLCQRRQFFT